MDATREKLMIKGKHFAITGILAFYKRKDAYDQIDVHGGYSHGNVTKNTDYLVVGYYRPNSIHGGKSNKTRLAEKYIRQGMNTKIIKEDEFLGMLWSVPIKNELKEAHKKKKLNGTVSVVFSRAARRS